MKRLRRVEPHAVTATSLVFYRLIDGYLDERAQSLFGSCNMFTHQQFGEFRVAFFNGHQDPAMFFKSPFAATRYTFMRPSGKPKLRVKIPAQNVEQDRIAGPPDDDVVKIQIFRILQIGAVGS